MIQLPKFWNYGEYSSSNYGAHCIAFQDANNNTFWFSYETLVAFRHHNHAKVVHENDWGTTTGKHLNWIDGSSHSRRVNDEEFNRIFKEQFGK